MRIRLGLMAAAFAGLAALSAPANASPAQDGRIVVAQDIQVRIGDDRPRVRERRVIHERRVRRGPERCRVRIVRERRHGRMVEKRTRICR